MTGIDGVERAAEGAAEQTLEDDPSDRAVADAPTSVTDAGMSSARSEWSPAPCGNESLCRYGKTMRSVSCYDDLQESCRRARAAPRRRGVRRVGYNGLRRDAETTLIALGPTPTLLLQAAGRRLRRLQQGTHNPLVAGSNPAGPTYKSIAIEISYRPMLTNWRPVPLLCHLRRKAGPREALQRRAGVAQCFCPLPVSSSTSASKNASTAGDPCANWSRSTIAAEMLNSSSDGSIAASGGSNS